jgi:hypothetical protein
MKFPELPHGQMSSGYGVIYRANGDAYFEPHDYRITPRSTYIGHVQRDGTGWRAQDAYGHPLHQRFSRKRDAAIALLRWKDFA